MSGRTRIAVIGAGPAGLTCARELADAGLAPQVFEKSRGIGGRVATRRRDGLQFDHGAQFLGLAEDDPLLEAAAKSGRAARWPAAAGADGVAPWVGVPTMKEPLRALAEGLDIAFDAEITEIARAGAGWRIATGSDAEVFDRVVLAMPAPQILRALSPAEAELHQCLAGATFEPCYVLMAAFDAPTGWADVMRAPGAPFALIQREDSKPGRPAASEAWVAHATAEWSRAHLASAPPDADRPAAAEALMRALAATMGRLPTVRAAIGHRWRFSRTETPLGRPFAASEDGSLLAGGDWALGRDISHARESGRAMARALLRTLA